MEESESEANAGLSADEVIAQLRAELVSKNSELAYKTACVEELELKAAASGASIHAFHAQQKQLFDEFCLLRQRYDDQKASLIDILWTQCAPNHKELCDIPRFVEEDVAVETDKEVGKYGVGELLGEGQFATVKNCWLRDAPLTEAGAGEQSGEVEWAIKIIKKERITSFSSLRRVSNEIHILKTLRSKYVVKLNDAIQSRGKLYIVTEKGGKDLFEFFDEHPEGVPEPWAREITVNILHAIAYCHKQGICHRDLKPENILIKFDYELERCLDLKLCDFGLSLRFSPSELLTDFCGSPGFFAPEMLIHGSYFGDKADVWSCGCILLELILGHERFCDVWMSAYDFEVLQDKAVFEDMIQSAVQSLPDALEFPPDLKDFIIQFLKLRSSERSGVHHFGRHAWIRDLYGADDDGQGSPGAAEADGFARLTLVVPSPRTVAEMVEAEAAVRVGSPSSHRTIAAPDGKEVQNFVKIAGKSVSDKERKMYEEHNLHCDQHDETSTNTSSGAAGEKAHAHHQHHHLHLPPIEPQTPSLSKFKKILKKAEEFAPAGAHWQPLSEEELLFKTNSSAGAGHHHHRLHDGPLEDNSPPLEEKKLMSTPRQLLSSVSDPRLV